MRIRSTSAQPSRGATAFVLASALVSPFLSALPARAQQPKSAKTERRARTPGTVISTPTAAPAARAAQPAAPPATTSRANRQYRPVRTVDDAAPASRKPAAAPQPYTASPSPRAAESTGHPRERQVAAPAGARGSSTLAAADPAPVDPGSSATRPPTVRTDSASSGTPDGAPPRRAYGTSDASSSVSAAPVASTATPPTVPASSPLPRRRRPRRPCRLPPRRRRPRHRPGRSRSIPPRHSCRRVRLRPPRRPSRLPFPPLHRPRLRSWRPRP